MKCTGRWSYSLQVCLVLLSLLVCPAAMGQGTGCQSDASALAGVIDDGDLNATNAVLNTYAAIFRDADPQNPNCNARAATHLLNKLKDTFGQDKPIDLVSVNDPCTDPTHCSYRTHDFIINGKRLATFGPFKGWLEGAFVTYIFPTAYRLHGEGWISPGGDLEKYLDKVAEFMNSTAILDSQGRFVDLTSRDPTHCSLDSSGDFGNNCMDDYSIAAAGFAWAAAYQTFRNRPRLPSLVAAANGALSASFSTDRSICIVPNNIAQPGTYDMLADGRGPCTGNAAQLRDKTAKTLSLNHGQQSPAYGYGLLTSISSALLGLSVAGSPHSFLGDEPTIALALLQEADDVTEPGNIAGGFKFSDPGDPVHPQACLKVQFPAQTMTGDDRTHFQIISGKRCTDEGTPGYEPGMYPLTSFYSEFIVGPIPPGPLPLSFAGSALFNHALPGGFFAVGREVYYGSLGWDARTSLSPPVSPLPPLLPNPVYPGDGTLHAPSSFTLRWNDGLDSARRRPQWPVTYAIYYKAWNYGSPEPASYFFFGSGFQCNPDSTGACTLSVSNVAPGNYRWYVVASMDVSISTGVPNSILSAQGTVAFFTIGNQPISTIPAPLPPTPVYPGDGAQNVSSSFPVRWNDGLDASRRNPLWPVTYAIYYKTWPFGGFEPANYTLVVAAQPCNSVTFGTCETFVTGMPDGNYRWYVIANMDVSASTGISNSILSTQSSVATFTVGQPQTGISVVAGTYGGNCGAPHGNVTGALASACNTLGRCDYIVDYTIIGDPAPGCAKDYVAEWTCNGQSLVQQATASPEAGFRKTVTLTCP